MNKPKRKSQIDWLADHIKELQAELDIWRSRYPQSAYNVREQAVAKIAGREPNYITTVMGQA